MPCRDGGNDCSNSNDLARIRYLQEKLDFVTNLLCGLCYDAKEKVVFSYELSEWYNDHKKIDEERVIEQVNEQFDSREFEILRKYFKKLK